jgi:peptidoglycan/LPS O-acetylase OafA/YrhL
VPKPSARGSVGLYLAVLAGLTALGTVIWPIAPIATTGAGPWWLLQAGIGAAFLLAAFLADRQPLVARVILGVGALVLAACAAVFSGLLAGQPALNASLLFLVPALLALAAVFLMDTRPTRLS